MSLVSSGPMPGGRLVEQQQFGVGDERDGDLKRALLAMSQKLRCVVAARMKPYGGKRSIGLVVEFRQPLAIGQDVVARPESLRRHAHILTHA